MQPLRGLQSKKRHVNAKVIRHKYILSYWELAEENPYHYGVPLEREGDVLICNILLKMHVLGH